MHRHRLELLLVALVAGFVGSWLHGQASRDAHADEASTVTATRFVLQDAAGKDRIVMEMNGAAPAIRIYDEAGTRRAQLAQWGSGTQLVMYDKAGTQTASYGESGAVIGEKHVKAAELTQDELTFWGTNTGADAVATYNRDGMWVAVAGNPLIAAWVRIVDGSYKGVFDDSSWTKPAAKTK